MRVLFKFGHNSRGVNLAVTPENIDDFPWGGGQGLQSSWNPNTREITIWESKEGALLHRCKENRGAGCTYLQWQGEIFASMEDHRRVDRVGHFDGNTLKFTLPAASKLLPCREVRSVRRHKTNNQVRNAVQELNKMLCDRSDLEARVENDRVIVSYQARQDL